jgi:hypothetical protein
MPCFQLLMTIGEQFGSKIRNIRLRFAADIALRELAATTYPASRRQFSQNGINPRLVISSTGAGLKITAIVFPACHWILTEPQPGCRILHLRRNPLHRIRNATLLYFDLSGYLTHRFLNCS